MSKKQGITIDGQAEIVADETPAEMAADLARLEAMTEESQGPGPGSNPEPEPAPEVSPEESLAGFLTVAAMAAGLVGYKRAAAVWSIETCRGFAERAVPVLEKYAWGQRALSFLTSGAGVEEMALAMYAAPVILATVSAAREDAAERAPKDESGVDNHGSGSDSEHEKAGPVEWMRDVHGNS